MQKTQFAGLTALDPGEPLSTDGYAFQAVNPLITDPLLKLGARTHRHDEHPPIADPIDAPGLTLTQDGNLPADADIAITYTLIDSDGGETRPAPAALVTTAPAMDPPDGAALVEVQDTGGHILAGSYSYAITLTDPNGETPAGAPFFVDVPPGTDTNVVILTGFADIVEATPGATGWRLYKSSSVGQLHFLAAGGVGLDEVTDDGMLCADCNVTPPTQNTTSVAQGIDVLVPETVTNSATGVVGYRIYAAVGGAFASPSYVEQRDDFGVTQHYTHIVVNPGMPPDVSTSFGGAQKINPDTDLLNWHWKQPVPTVADLPEPSEGGDVRVVEEDGTVWIYDAAANNWHQFEAPAMYWKPAVADVPDLPPVGDPNNVVGDVRMVLSTRNLWSFTAGGQWTNITSPPHNILSDIAVMPQRGNLQFINCDVEDDQANDRTIVTAKGDGGGGGGLPAKLKISLNEGVEWVDDAGVTQLKLRGQRNITEYPWISDGFDEAPLAGWGGAPGNVGVSDPPGNLVPLDTHPLTTDKAYWMGGAGTNREFDITTEGIVFNALTWNHFGVSLVTGANGQKGIRLILMQYDDEGTPGFRARLEYRLDEAVPWVTIQEWDVDPATVIVGEHNSMRLHRDGNTFSVGMWNYDTGVDLFGEDGIDVPADLLNFEGAPAIVSNITDPVSWQVDMFYITYILPSYQLLATATLGGEKVLVDSAPDQYAWMYSPGDAAAGWYPDFQIRKTPEGGVQFRGRVTKGEDAAPLADELMFTFDAEKVNIPGFIAPVVTSDIDGVKVLGMVQFDGGLNQMRWLSGTSTDPATKMPYVLLDGVSY